MYGKEWTRKEILWGDFIRKLQEPRRTPETVKEYKAMSQSERATRKDVGGFVGGSLAGPSRIKKDITARSLITLDLDHLDIGADAVHVDYLMAIGSEAVFYSTHSHTPEAPRLRIVIPLDREVSADEWMAISRKVAETLGLERIDPASFEPHQIMFWPSTSSDGEYIFKHVEGDALKADEWLAKYNDWKNISEWPRHQKEEATTHAASTTQADPTEKDGDIGLFNRAYSIQEAIETFLSEVYLATDNPNIYTYSKGTTANGGKVYDNKFFFSHHSTDPASRMTCSAFDLVRLHLYGDLDNGILKDTPPEKLPSFKRMLEHARSDSKVLAIQLQEEFGLDNSDEEPALLIDSSGAPVKYLEKNKRSGQISVNTALLAEHFKEYEKYLIVRKQGFDNDILYYYQKGYYGRTSANELKGKLKTYIPLPIRKPIQWEEAYRNLITESCTTSFEDLDADERYINFRNGLLNVKTWDLEPHRANVFSTIRVDRDYVPGAPEPKIFLNFLETLVQGDQELKAIIQEFIGLAISNIPGFKTKKSLALWGPRGNNGKTIIIKLINELLGNEFVSSTSIQDLSKQFALSTLYGKRGLIIDDQTSADLTDSSAFKAITGGGPVQVEFKGLHAFSWIFKGVIIFGCNDMFYVKGDKGDHLFKRIVIIPCMNTIAEDKQDHSLFEKVMTEAEGIIIWALEGLKRVIASDFRITESQAANAAMKEFRENNDSMYKFLNEMCEVTGNHKDRIGKAEFERQYETWCATEGISYLDRKNIKGRVMKHGIYLKNNNGFKYYGVRFKPLLGMGYQFPG
jgi:putative DNA primase/helicase